MLTVVQLLSLSGQVLALNIHDPNLRLVVGGLAITLTGISVFMTERRQLS